mgnify:CR=1 FL=1
MSQNEFKDFQKDVSSNLGLAQLFAEATANFAKDHGYAVEEKDVMQFLIDNGFVPEDLQEKLSRPNQGAVDQPPTNVGSGKIDYDASINW